MSLNQFKYFHLNFEDFRSKNKICLLILDERLNVFEFDFIFKYFTYIFVLNLALGVKLIVNSEIFTEINEFVYKFDLKKKVFLIWKFE